MDFDSFPQFMNMTKDHIGEKHRTVHVSMVNIQFSKSGNGHDGTLPQLSDCKTIRSRSTIIIDGLCGADFRLGSPSVWKCIFEIY